MKKRIISLLLIVLFASSLLACVKEEEPKLYYLRTFDFVFGEEDIGQIYADLKLWSWDESKLKPCSDEIMQTLKDIDKEVSTSKKSPASFVYTFNNTQSTQKFYIDDYPHVIHLIERAKALYRETDKLFNPAIYPLMELWGLDANSLSKYNLGLKEFTMDDIPSQEEIDNIMPLIDFDKIIFGSDHKGMYIQKTYPGQKIDFGGQAKGYGADLAIEIAKKHGVALVAIDLGGNTMVYTDREQITVEQLDGFTIGIRKPCPDEREARIATFKVVSGSVVTSGDYERNFMVDGILFAHVLNPLTGYPANLEVSTDGEGNRAFRNPDLGIRSSTIINANSEFADILAKVVMLKGIESGIDYLESKGLTGVIVTKDKHYAAVGQFEMVDSEYDIYKTEYTPYLYKGKTYSFEQAQ